MRGNREFLAQALANILDNAVKYTPAGGAIMLRVRRRSSGEVEFSVTDTGPGVPDGDRERVVQRFVRLENSRNQPGAGLGLSLVAAVAEAHGGRLELDEGPGKVGEIGPGPAGGPGPAAAGLTRRSGRAPAHDASANSSSPAARWSTPRRPSARASDRRRGLLDRRGWSAAWPALAPVFAASPYLAGLARRDPERLDGPAGGRSGRAAGRHPARAPPPCAGARHARPRPARCAS